MTVFSVLPHFHTSISIHLDWCCCCCQVASVVSFVRPHRRQPTRLPRPWESPGKNTGVGCHFLLQCMKVESESEVAQSCPTLSDPVGCSPPGSSVRGIFQARALEWVPLPYPSLRLCQGKNAECVIRTRGKFLELQGRKHSPASQEP